MSADNAVFVRQIDNYWYVQEGSMSNDDPWADEWYDGADSFCSRGDALNHAHDMVDRIGVVEYGVRITEGYI